MKYILVISIPHESCSFQEFDNEQDALDAYTKAGGFENEDVRLFIEPIILVEHKIVLREK